MQHFSQIVPRVCTLVLFILQGLIDYNYIFLDVYVGWPGSVHDVHMCLPIPHGIMNYVPEILPSAADKK